MGKFFASSATTRLRATSFVAYDFMHFKHGSDTDQLVAIPQAIIYPNDFSAGPYEDISTACDFGKKHHREA